jgi:nucleoside-diphosphate-sugar epimerase
MKLFLTGVTGYIGSKVALAAVAKGFEVHALIRNPDAFTKPDHPNIKYFKGDITDYNSVNTAMKECSYVMHTAALTQLWHSDRSKMYAVNVGGTRNVLQAAIENNIQKFVFTSSCSVFGSSPLKPLAEDDHRSTAFENDYEISKFCAEELVKEFSHKGLFATIVCPPRVYGPGLCTKGNPVSKLITDAMQRSFTIAPAATAIVGNYAFIDDVVEGHFLAMQKGLAGEKYIIGGENICYGDFFNAIKKNSPKKIYVIPLPKYLIKTWSCVVYIIHFLLGKHTHLTPKTVERLFENRAVSCKKAIQQLGYQITPFQQGITRTIQYLNNGQNA